MKRRCASVFCLMAGVLFSASAVAQVPAATPQAACIQGKADRFACRHVDLLTHLPVRFLGGSGRLNDLWGWTDPETGRVYALVGRADGVAFVDLTEPTRPDFVGLLPGFPSPWRDVKTYAGHAYVVSEAAGHGMQVFDLAQLRTVTNPPVTFAETAHYTGIQSAHNLAINEATGFAYVLGAHGGGETCGGGLHMIDLADPIRPTFAGCFADLATGLAQTGYTHDAQCVVYHGPDEPYRGREVCFGANETHVSIADVTDKSAPVALAAASYPDVGYVHQGWLSEDHRYFFQNDELDLGPTRTLIWDVTDLDAPVLAAQYHGPTLSRDHNLYVAGDRMYQANYTAGLRILDVSSPTRPVEVAHFDTFPASDAAGLTGAWTAYPFLAGGVVIVSDITEGLFILRPNIPVGTAVASERVAEAFALAPASPNPFAGATTLTLTLPAAGPATVVAYDVLGRRVAVLHEGWTAPGVHRLRFEAAGLPAGAYLVRAVAGGAARARLLTRIP